MGPGGVTEPGGGGGDAVVGQEIGGERLDRHAVRTLELGGELGEARRVARHQHDVVAPRSERGGERASDTGRGAGDQRPPHDKSSAPATEAAEASIASPTCTSAIARCGSFSP